MADWKDRLSAKTEDATPNIDADFLLELDTSADAIVKVKPRSLLALYALLASPTFTGTPAAPTASPGTNTTQIATTAYVIAEILARVASLDVMVFKGVIDCSANPNYPAADAGATYRISVAGKIGGASGVNVTAGDMAICIADSTASGNQATVGAFWDVIEMNLDGAMTTAGGTFTGDIHVPDDAYDATTWNGSDKVPTKNAIRDKIETLIAGTYTDEQAQDAVGAMIDASLNYVDATPLLQRAALTGDVTASAGSNATTIANDAVTYAKMQNVSATSRVLGRITAGAGDPEELTGSNVRTIAGLATGDSPQFTAIELGNASDTTISRTGAGDIAVEGNAIYRAGGTDVPVADGGTGSSTASGARTNLGLVIGTDVQAHDSDLDTWAGITPGTNVGTNLAKNADGSVVDAIGFRGIPQNSQSAAYTTVMADAGKEIFHPSSDANARTFTIDSNANVAYPIGTVIVFTNDSANAVTIAITSDTLVLVGTGSTGSRTLAQYGQATARKVGSTRWYISGTNLT